MVKVIKYKILKDGELYGSAGFGGYFETYEKANTECAKLNAKNDGVYTVEMCSLEVP